MTFNGFANFSDVNMISDSVDFTFGVEGYTNKITGYDNYTNEILQKYSFSRRLEYGEYVSSYFDIQLGDISELSNTDEKKPIAAAIKSSGL